MIFKRNTLVVITLSLALLVACAPTMQAPTAAPTPVHWSYTGEEGPTHWSELNSSFALCNSGKEQSPIDLTGAEQRDLPNIVFHYQSSKVNIINNGHTIQVNYDPGSYIELDGARYDLLQFHFHAPSEHSIDGKLADAELHLVHKNAAGNLAVVGIMINHGPINNAIQSVLENMPAQAGPAQTLDAQINANDLLPAIQTTYRYDGSLTTPPCTEGVKWLVMTTPLTFSTEQLAAFTKLFAGNNRPAQALNGRPEVEDTSP